VSSSAADIGFFLLAGDEPFAVLVVNTSSGNNARARFRLGVVTLPNAKSAI
jgi:hypothetical protein